MLQISAMCLPAFGFGNPLTTMYASPIVSTWQTLRHVFLLYYYYYFIDATRGVYPYIPLAQMSTKDNFLGVY